MGFILKTLPNNHEQNLICQIDLKHIINAVSVTYGYFTMIFKENSVTDNSHRY